MAETRNLFAVSKAMGHAKVKNMEPYQHQDTSRIVLPINKRNLQAPALLARAVLWTEEISSGLMMVTACVIPTAFPLFA